MGRKKNIAESLSRYIHSLSGFLLINPLQIGKPDRFQFIKGQCHHFKETGEYAARLETYGFGFTAHPPWFAWSGHPVSFISGICQ
jgi:hypothetical protein